MLARVAREPEVRLLERRPRRHELLERDPVGREQPRHLRRGSPWTVTRSRPFETGVAPAFASTVIAAATSGVVIATWPSEAVAMSSSTETSARSRPCRSRSGDRRCPRARSSGGSRRRRSGPRRERAERLPHPADPLRIEADRRLVEDQDRRVAEQRGRDPEPLPHAERERPTRRPATPASPTRRSTSSDAAARRSRCSARSSEGGFAPSGRDGRPPRPAARRRRSAGARSSTYAAPATSASPAWRREAEQQLHGRRLARAVRPDEPVTRPGRTAIERSSTATVLP